MRNFGQHRIMLDFLGIGAQKCGTSWLHRQLSQHPDIYMPPRKELHYWDQNRSRGREWYDRQFKNATAEQKRGEITPAYAILPVDVIRDIRRDFPNIRMVYLLRDPVERAWSSALMALGRAEMKIEEASDQWFIDHFLSEGSRHRGDYETCLRNWSSVFGSSRVRVLLLDDVKADPCSALDSCFDHIGVAPRAGHIAGVREKVFAGSGHPIRPSLRAFLVEMYRPKVEPLEQLLGRDLSAWRDAMS
jgi:hypothetical protein